MEAVIDLDSFVNFSPSSVAEEIVQNCRTILSTILGSVPLERDIGLSWEYVGQPTFISKDLLKAAVYDAFGKQEPRAEILSIDFPESDNTQENLENGILKPKVKIYIDN